jgi:anti-anti-sigma factor
MTVPPHEAPGMITLVDEDGAFVLCLADEIDTAVVTSFEATAADASHGEQRPTEAVSIVDVSAVTFIDSVGLTFLVRQTQTARDSGLLPVLRRPTAPVSRALELTGVDRLFRTVS